MQSTPDSSTPLFSSFIMGGFECAYPVCMNGKRIDLLADSKHDRRTRQDYRLIKQAGITTVREGLSWSKIDRNDTYDFSRFERMMIAASAEDVEVIWDLNHFDYPDDIDIMSDTFIECFAAYAVAAVRVMRKYSNSTLHVVPFNEISYFSFAGGYIAHWAPFMSGKKEELQTQIVRAVLAAQRAMHSVDPDIRFIHVDPLFRLIPKDPTNSGQAKIAAYYREDYRFAAWDMIAGLKRPELGGSPEMLDIIGVNYYVTGQQWMTTDDWSKEAVCRETIPMGHPDRIPFGDLLREVYERYERPILITETGSYSEFRTDWWQTVLPEIEAATQTLPITGVCAYPIIDRHDWDDGHLTHSGLWDFQDEDPTLQRVPHWDSIKLFGAFGRRMRRKLRDEVLITEPAAGTGLRKTLPALAKEAGTSLM